MKLRKQICLIIGMLLIAGPALANNTTSTVNTTTNSTVNSTTNNTNTNNNTNGNNDEPHPVEKVDLDAILSSLAENVILPVYQDFQTAAVGFQAASNDYAAAVLDDSSDLASKQTAMEEAWKTAMAAWQHAEMLQIGPAGNSSKVATVIVDSDSAAPTR